MSETKAAFAERTIRAPKNILYRHMEDNGYKNIHKCTHFATTSNSIRNCSLDLIPKNETNTDFLSILYSIPLQGFRKHMFKKGDRVRISTKDLPFRKAYMLQFTQKVSGINVISSKKPPTYTKENVNKMRLSVAKIFKMI